VLKEEEKNMLELAAFFVSVSYAQPPWFLKSYLVEKSYSNYLAAIKFAFQLKEPYPTLGQALLTRMQHHNWYYSEKLVVLALADDDSEEM
jgi:hypothetical protein